MHKTAFTAEIRVLLCENCGAPLEAPLGGGAFACTYCRAHNAVSVRDERPTLGMPAVPAPIDEGTRLAQLRAQDGRPLVPPSSLHYLLQGSSFDPSKVQEAFLVYQATRKEVKATNSPEAAERLYFLTLVASNYLAEQRDDARRRAILETSLDTLFLPRHKQVMRCQLATAAAKEGDLAAAERWIGPCDPRSIDLESDSAWRCCRAYIDTIRGDLQAVLSVLGTSDEAVPIVDARDPMAAVLRANALERLGNVQAAVAALRSRMAGENASGRAAIEAFVRLNPALQLCPQSLAAASQGHAAQAAKVAASGAGGAVGMVLMGIALLLILVDLGIAALVLVPTVAGTFYATGLNFGALLGALGGSVAVCAGPTIASAVLFPIGFVLHRNAREAAFLRMHGVSARGTVRALEATGTRINNVPLLRVHVTVHRDGMAPYDGSFRQLCGPGLAAQLTPGTQVPLRVHPQRPDKMILELT